MLERLGTKLMEGLRAVWAALVAALRTVGAWSLALGRGLRRVMRSERLLAVVRRVRRLGLSVAAGALLACVLFGLLKLGVHRVPPGAIGVSQARFGTGLEEVDHGPGLQLSVLDRWYHLDGRTQEVRFAWESEGGTRPALELVTRDGEKVSVAAGLLYAIAEGGAHQLVAAGLGKDFQVRAEAIARRVLVEEFQTLGAEDWFDPGQRARIADQALERLGAEFQTCYLRAEEVLVSGVYFPPTFEKKRLQLQLDAQGRKTSEALARRRAADLTLAEAKAEHEATLARASETWAERLAEVNLEAAAAEREIELDVKRQVAELSNEANDQHGRLAHEGELALTAAKGLHEELQAGIWAGPGGSEYLAREAARKLTFGTITLDPGDPAVPNPLDLEGLSQLLLGSK